jgi:hypothetical protein
VAVLKRRRSAWESGIATFAANALTPRDKVLTIFDFLDAWLNRGPSRRGRPRTRGRTNLLDAAA